MFSMIEIDGFAYQTRIAIPQFFEPFPTSILLDQSTKARERSGSRGFSGPWPLLEVSGAFWLVFGARNKGIILATHFLDGFPL